MVDGLVENALRVVPSGAPIVLAVGSGLGLALAYGPVTRLGGLIEAGHAPEGSARFRCRLHCGHRPWIYLVPNIVLNRVLPTRSWVCGMRKMTYQKKWTGRLLAVGALAAVGLTGVAACGPGATPSGSAAPLTVEEQALTDLGYDVAEVLPAATPSGEPGGRPGKPYAHRRHLGKRILHGEFVVSTDDGTKTILVQRGTVTAVGDDSMTVKSADGYSLTWTFGDKLRVIEKRKTVNGDALKVGDKVGAVGGKSGAGGEARLILIAP